MSERFGCEQVTGLAPELALGTAAGDERAEALEHLATCASCRRLVNELSGLTDEIVGLAPPMEPPAGFENRVLERFGERNRKDRRWAWMVAAALLGALATTALLLVAFDADRDLAAQYRGALDIANGEYFGVRPLEGDDEMQEGYLFIYDGKPSWIFLTLDDSDGGPYTVEAHMDDDHEVDLGSFTLEEGKRSWGTTMDIDMSKLSRLVVRERGGEVLTAQVAHH